MSQIDYKVSSGLQIGVLGTEFGANGSLIEKKLTASVAVTKGQVVELSGSLTVRPTTAASANVLGVAMADAKVGEPVAVETQGLFKLIASAGIVAPTAVESAADGKVATKGGTPVKLIGMALNSCSAGEYCYVKFNV